MIKRWLIEELEHKMAYRRGVHLTGARQVGKSTLASMLDLPSCRRYTLDDDKVRDAAANDPHGFVNRREGETLVIDEVQKVPAILDAIKIAVDASDSRGQYLLTGSSDLHFAKSIRDSLAGRLGKIRLRPLSLGELNGRGPSFLSHAFAGDFAREYPDIDKRGIIHLGFVGGYPEPRNFSMRERKEWFKEYLDDLLNKDVRDLTEIRKVDVLHGIALWLLSHSAQFFSVDELATKAGVSRITAQGYLDALKALYLFDCVPAWAKSDYDHLGKRPKWISSDAGMMASLLDWKEEDVYLDASRSGKFVESWVYQQLAAIAEAVGGYSISHYRDSKKREIDFIVERDDGSMLGIVVKAGNVGKEDFRHLEWFRDNIASEPFAGMVLYSGKNVLSFGEHMLAVPLSALGE